MEKYGVSQKDVDELVKSGKAKNEEEARTKVASGVSPKRHPPAGENYDLEDYLEDKDGEGRSVKTPD